MAPQHRSRRARLAALSAQLRSEGKSWTQIARRIQEQERVNARVAFRLARGWTQEQVAQRWNDQWPSKDASTGITDKNISYWETWPQSGYEPSLKTLKRLAQLYQCDVGQLVEDGDYRHLDDLNRGGGTRRGKPGALAPGFELVRVPATARLPEIPVTLGDDVAWAAASLGPQADERSGGLLVPLRMLAELAHHQIATAREREVLYEQLVRVLASWADRMNRRDLLRVLGWAATAAAAAPLFPGLDLDEQARVIGAIDAPQRIDETVVGHIEAVLWSAMRQDDTLGPQAALDTVLAQRNLTRALLLECPLSLRPRLLSLFSNLSRFAGWLAFDLGDFGSAGYYYEQARTAAHEAENTELGVFVLCNMSHLATWRGQPRVGIDHAVAAQGWARETADPLLRAYAADVAARAYAAAGRRQDCVRALDAIPGVIGTSGAGTPDTSLAYFYGPGLHALSRAQCLVTLHDADGAAQAARQALQLVDPSFVRNHAFGTLHLASACLEAREPEEAARLAGITAGLADRNRSARLVEQLRRTRSRLDPWRRTPAVKTLDEQLASYGWEPSSRT